MIRNSFLSLSRIWFWQIQRLESFKPVNEPTAVSPDPKYQVRIRYVFDFPTLGQRLWWLWRLEIPSASSLFAELYEKRKVISMVSRIKTASQIDGSLACISYPIVWFIESSISSEHTALQNAWNRFGHWAKTPCRSNNPLVKLFCSNFSGYKFIIFPTTSHSNTNPEW